MKRVFLCMIGLSLLLLIPAGGSQAWQGRMGGMGDPYGLISDESDFLTHPAKLSGGEGVRFYGDYRFVYTGVTDWDFELDTFTPAGVLIDDLSKETSGEEQEHESLLGAAFPLGSGRMGLFFQYSGKRGKYDGDQVDLNLPATYFYDNYDLQHDVDDFALRLLFGLPLSGLALGGEFQVAYRQEKNEIKYLEDFGGGTYFLWTNFPKGTSNPWREFFYFMLPYDSQYWQALFKGSIEGAIGPVDVEFTPRGGFIFGGNNEYACEGQVPPAERFDLDGDVEGSQFGGDLWVRYPLADDLSLPFLVRIDFQDKTRDGDGPGLLDLTGRNYAYESEERNFQIEAGGGVDKEFGKGTRIAGGIYYRYLEYKDDFSITESLPGGVSLNFDHSDFPSHTEHQVSVRFAGEREFTPAVALRMGLNFFYGWVQEDFVFNESDPVGIYTDDISSDGYRWGVGAAAGGTLEFDHFTLEPFLNAGYQELDLDGDGENTIDGVLVQLYDMGMDRREWYISAGFSISL